MLAVPHGRNIAEIGCFYREIILIYRAEREKRIARP